MNMNPPKSILKKTPVTAAAAAASKPVNERHLQVALHHANILEERKRVEAEVLDAIMTLMDYPTASDADPKRPSAADAQSFRDAVLPFQPADYDALIEERNIADKCGYALCPRPTKKARSTARKQFVDTDHGVEIVDRKTLEVWCSDDCARRALYVKVQLSEEPAWMRQGGYGDKMELLVDNTQEIHTALPLRPKKAPVVEATNDDDDDIAAAWAARDDAMGDLALERGEKPGQVSKANNDLVRDQITERAPSNVPPQPPSLPAQISEHTMAIEGHVPRSDRKAPGSEDEDDEEDAQDWDKHLPS
jgi:RNA polymerase II-associated protein 2